MEQRSYNETPSELEKKLRKDYNSGAEIIEVSPSQLPPGVLGMYDSTNHVIYISNNLSALERNFVHHHESGHGQGIIDESKTDAYANSKTGYNLRPLGNSRTRNLAA